MIPGLSLALFGARGAGVVPSIAGVWDNIAPGDVAGENTPILIEGLGETILMRAEISSVAWVGSSYGRAAYLYAGATGDVVGVDVSNGAVGDFVVDPDVFVGFAATADAFYLWSLSYTVTVKYKSAGSPTFDQTLDTFTVALSGSGSGSGGGGGEYF